MNFEEDQIITIFYMVLGCLVGFASLYLNNFFSIFGLLLSTYTITIVLIKRKTITRKPVELLKIFISDILLIYILIWITAYIFLANILL